jgi:hypothetical protein
MSSPVPPVASVAPRPADPVPVSEAPLGKFAERMAELQQADEKQEILPHMVKTLMRDLEVGQLTVNRLVKAASTGAEFSNAELLALQATMYRYNLEIDLLSKMVQSLVQGLRDLLKMQV